MVRTVFVLLGAVALIGLAPPPIPPSVASDLSAVRKLARSGDRLWPGFSTAPFGFLFVTAEGETLLCDSRVPPGFTAVGRNATLDCAQATGPTSWRKDDLLAAMPAFGPPSVIVMGSPKGTGRTRPEWTRIVLHEHFHQWQADLPDYYERVAALDLAHGDQSGMWMLNYAFPYADPKVDKAFAKASMALRRAIDSPAAERSVRLRDYLIERAALAASVTSEQWRYFDFQLWQEGVARWTEMTLGEASPDAAVATASRKLRRETLDELLQPDLARKGRLALYAFGAAEAVLLEQNDPDWRGCYRVSLGLGQCWSAQPAARRLPR